MMFCEHIKLLMKKHIIKTVFCNKFIKENDSIYYHTCPKTPKQNARCDSVNRTIQDELMIKYSNLLFDDITFCGLLAFFWRKLVAEKIAKDIQYQTNRVIERVMQLCNKP